MTQSSLSQVVALTTLTEMSSEMKPLDLRMSETLTHNLIRISDLIEPQSHALEIMALIMKDVAPKWRMAFLRKIFSSEKAKFGVKILPMFIHQFGTVCHPLVKELLNDDLMNLEATREVAKQSGKIICAVSRKTLVKREILRGNCLREGMFCKICHGEVKFDNLNGFRDFFMELFQRLIGHEDQIVQFKTVENLLEPMAFHGLINAG